MGESNMISIIIPMYNSENTIVRCLNSTINQEYLSFEIILIDDCSSDNTINIATNFLTENNIHYTLIRNTENMGAGASRNLGVSMARGRYIAFLDSDDYWCPQKIQKQLPLLNKFPIVGGNYRVFSKNNDKVINVDLSGEFSYFNFLYENHLATSSVIIDSSRFDKKDIFFKNVVHDDYLLWLTLLSKYKYKVKVIESTSFTYERRSGSLSSGLLNKIFSTYNVFRYHKLNFLLSFLCTVIKLSNSLIKRY